MCPNSYQYLDFSIKEIQLVNYRKFDALTVTLHQQITALTALNGGGKSAVLQALAVGCAHFVYGLGIYPGIRNGFSPDDHMLVPQEGMAMVPAQGDMEIHCKGSILGCEAEWSRELSHKVNAKTRYGNAIVLQRAASELLHQSADFDSKVSDIYPVAPVIAFYDTRRLARESRLTEKRKPQQHNRFEGYADCLALGSYIRVFKNWFKGICAQLLQETHGSPRHAMLNNQRNIVDNAVSSALRHVQWSNLKWDFIKNDLTLEHPETGTLCFSQLSDGIQNVLNMVADLAHRAVRLNPCAPPDLLSHIKGFVLIDEVDMYLHPQWQQQIIPVLCTIFPCVQFVISSHSPQVLSTLRKEQIRCIAKNAGNRYSALEPQVNPYAKASSSALAGVLDTPSVPTLAETPEIERLEALYVAGEDDQADNLRKALSMRGVDIPQEDIDFWRFIAGKQNR